MNNSEFSAAPVWRRLAALLYDSFILLAISFLYGAAATLAGTLAGWHQADYQPMFRHWLFTLGWVAVLAGWLVTEIGRQPWLVSGVLYTADAAGSATGGQVGMSLAAYAFTYAVLLVSYIIVLTHLSGKGAQSAAR